MTSIELLAPAGSPEALDAAVGEGADAVYLGLKSFNARMRSANFSYAQFEGALRALHRQRKKVYVTVNTVFEQREADRVYQLLHYLAALGPDGILVQDAGAAALCRSCFPTLKLHASTQMNIASARGVNLLSKCGFSRAVLARELSLSEIAAIRSSTNLELEVFVHGALCVSESGLCLFSSYLGGKSANRGQCTQACRRLYFPSEGGEGGYFFSTRDLALIEKVPALAEAGVNSFKIEGRMKSAEYVGTVVSAYRRVLDSLGGGPEVEERALREARDILQNDFARRKTLFHFDGVRADGWLNAESAGGTGIPLGRVLRVKAGRGFTDARDITVAVGDSIRVHKGDDSSRAVHKVTFVQTDDAGLWLSLPEGFGLGDTVYLIQTKAMTRRYAPVIAKHLEGHRAPGHEKAPPPPPLVKIKKDKDDEIPPGLVALVRRPEDLYVLQSARPEKAALRYRSAFVPLLLARGKSPLPFAPRDLVIALDPFFPQASDEDLAKNIPLLLEKGYHFFILNNPGQFSFFRGTDAVLIAGPWLYTFNGYAAAFFAGLGARYFIPPLEDNRQNLEKTFQREGGARALALVTLFSSPPLFRIRADLAACSTLNNSVKNSRDFTLFEAAADKVRRGLCPLGVCREENCAKTQFSLSNSAKRCKLLEGGYPFKVFADSRGEQFRLDSGGGEGTLVYPEKPFSIVDKARFLREAGFNKFLLDLSAAPLKKHDYRAITLALQKGAPLPNTGRFNWKEGFFAQKD